MNNIRLAREQSNKTQKDVQRDLKIAQSTLSNYENGVTDPSAEVLIKLADYFETSIDYLLGHESKIVELNSYPNYKRELIEAAIKLNERECEKAYAYVMGLLASRAESEKVIKAMTDYINSKNKGGA